MIKNIAAVAATVLLATSAFALDGSNVEKSYELKDGMTVYVFEDGKMAMEDKYGRVVPMMEGHAMETKDGQKIMMKGNEVWRLEAALGKHRGP